MPSRIDFLLCHKTNCEFKSIHLEDLQNHIKVIHEVQTPSNFQQKLINIHGYKDGDTDKVACPQCDKVMQKASLKYHIKSVHEKCQLFLCSDCDFETIWRSNLWKHVKSVHEAYDEVKTFKCSQCPFTTKQKYSLQRHIMHIHGKVKRKGEKVACPQCDKLIWKESLKGHIEGVHEGQSFPCPDCNFEAKWKSNLLNHVKSVHEGQKIYCPHCDYYAAQNSVLKMHIKNRHENKRKPKEERKVIKSYKYY